MNISPVNISFQGRKNRRAKNADTRRSYKGYCAEQMHKSPAEIKNEIKSLQNKLNNIRSQQAARLAEVDKIEDPAVRAAKKSLIIEERAHYSNIEENIKISIALLKSRL